MAGRVDQVQLVALPHHAHGLGLDRDPALALEIHRVEQLLAHVALGDGVGELEDAVGERRLAVVDVRDDREVADLDWSMGPLDVAASCEPTESSGRQLADAEQQARPDVGREACAEGDASSETIWAPIERPRTASSPAQTSCDTTASAPEPMSTSASSRIVSRQLDATDPPPQQLDQREAPAMLQSEVDSGMPQMPNR